ncbi:MAG: phage holin family protein [Rhodopseudomonas sp.]|uniref:phage holin family protein n=1 Tax=Rhodopseudomonas sp. TaxID=1078 RepID=UPI0017C7397E|nr:phage holin family protein [Rhodopseudomonas sp.]NVN85038.1 phage holin family protein [Rhodopseudomonas sp.]
MSSPSNRSIPELISDAFGQLANLVGNEFELARAEMSDKASQVGRAAALIGAGVAICIAALVLILLAIAAALVENGIAPSVAYLITGAGAAMIAAVLIWIGIGRLSGGALSPAVTLDQLQRDKVAAKEMVR